MERFLISGAAGYIAKRHFDAIQHHGGLVIGVCDPNDSVGFIDSISFNTRYFGTFEEMLAWNASLPEASRARTLVICAPNHAHFAQIMMGLAMGMAVICEKPATRNLTEFRTLQSMLTKEQAKRLHIISQLRSLPQFNELRSKIYHQFTESGVWRYVVRFDYRTPRGEWYGNSWKGDPRKSGGLTVNIGVHLFDFVGGIFGGAHLWPQIINARIKADPSERVSVNSPHRRGTLRFFLVRHNQLGEGAAHPDFFNPDRAAAVIDVDFNLSIAPLQSVPSRVISVTDGRDNGWIESVELSAPPHLHIDEYRRIFHGNGNSVADCEFAIHACDLVERGYQ